MGPPEGGVGRPRDPESDSVMLWGCWVLLVLSSPTALKLLPDCSSRISPIFRFPQASL